MPTVAALGEFEVLVLMAVLHADEEAYGSVVREEIERRSGRAVARGAVYITLERLEEKGLLVSMPGDTTPERGGRPRRLFRVTPMGVRSLKRAISTLTRKHKGLEPLLGKL
jgi:PadR family transcriptional regulator PadR